MKIRLLFLLTIFAYLNAFGLAANLSHELSTAESKWTTFINGIYYTEYNGEAAVIPGEYPNGHPTGTIIIPDRITVNGQDYTVTTLSSSSLAWIRNGQTLMLPESITTIGFMLWAKGL